MKVYDYGRGALMSKLDLADAYKHVLVHPDDWDLLGCTWNHHHTDGTSTTEYFVDLMLPFGLRSSAKLFTDVADALKWCMLYLGTSDVDHYLDDYITIGPAGTPVCADNLTIMLDTCKYVGFAVNPKKFTLPATEIEFLGLVIDSDNMEVRVSTDRVSDILEELRSFQGRRSCRKRELLPLVGKLIFVSRAVTSGRSFVRRIIDLSKRIRHLHHRVKLTRACRMDIEWWIQFFPTWDGVSLIPDPEWTPNTCMDLYTDASDVALAGYYAGQWFVLGYFGPLEHVRHASINFRELLALVITLATWGPHLRRKRILFHCDNMSVVHVLRNGVSRDSDMMKLVRLALFLSATYSVEYSAVHITSASNDVADSLSRSQWDRFRALAQGADTHPRVPTPHNLWYMTGH